MARLRDVAGAVAIAVVAGLLWTDPPAFGQKLTLGVVAGASLTGDFETGSSSYLYGETGSTTFIFSPIPRSFIAGPRLELRMRKLSLQVDALHRAVRSKFTQTFSPPIVLPNGASISSFGPSTSTHASWEFPVLAKYRFHAPKLSPFLEAGPSFRPAGAGSGVSHLGITGGAGVEMHLGSLSISPMVRYTHWKRRHGAAGVGAAIVDQVEALVAIQQAATAPGWTSAFGRRFSLGILTGVGVGDDLRVPQALPFGFGERSDSNSPVFGVLLEFEVRNNLFLGAEGIYRPLHATELSTLEGDVRFAVLTWEFPVLAKYKFRPDRPVRPFVELGPSFRTEGNFNGPRPSHYGITAGLGVEARVGKLKMSPTVRYTRWAEERSPQSPFRRSTFLNQVECLVGVSF